MPVNRPATTPAAHATDGRTLDDPLRIMTTTLHLAKFAVRGAWIPKQRLRDVYRPRAGVHEMPYGNICIAIGGAAAQFGGA